MADREFPLSIVIRTVDRATRGLRSVDQSVRRMTRGLPAFKKGLTGVGTELRNLGAAVGIGGAALASFGRTAIENERSLARIGIQANLTDKEMASIGKTATETGRAFGLSKSEVLGAATAIINLEGASGFSEKKMRTLAQAAMATGADLQDLAGTGFALTNAFGVQGDELGRAFSAVIEAGKQGSVPLNEMSVVLQQIGTDFAKVGASGTRGAAELAAAIQVARKGFGTAAETGTGLRAFVAQLEQNAAKLRKFSVEVVEVGEDGAERLRPIRAILDDIGNSRIIKEKGALTKAFGSSEARKFLETMIENRQAFDDLAEAAVTSNALVSDSQRFLDSSAGKLQRSLAIAKSEFEEIFTPERVQAFARFVRSELVPAVQSAVAGLSRFAESVRPVWEAIGGLRGALVILAGVMSVKLILAIKALSVALVATPFGLAVTAIAGVVAAGVLLVQNWATVKEFFVGLWDQLRAFGRWIEGTFLDTINAVVDAGSSAVSAVSDFGGGIVDFFTDDDEGSDAESHRRPSALLRQASDVATGPGASVRVEFANAPRGTRIASDPRSTTDVDLAVGYQLVTP